jgi:signal transduction histidine kinase
MPMVEPEFAMLRDPRLAAQLAERATSVAPAWLWSADGARIVWANAVGAAIFGAAHARQCAGRHFEAAHPAALEITRLAATLSAVGQPRLERLRGFGASFGRALTCICSRLLLSDGTTAILVLATEPAGPPLSLCDRVRRLFSDDDGPLAVLAPDGAMLYATASARARLQKCATPLGLAIAGLADPLPREGNAGAVGDDAPPTVMRLGSGPAAVLVLIWPPGPPQAQAGGGAALKSEAAPAAFTAPAMPDSLPQEPAQRSHPLRFVWQMDADGRFVIGPDELVELMGPRTTAALGRPWSEIATELKLDPENRVARVVATRQTWSGVTVSWPVGESDERLPVELSGLPVFDRDRKFCGYRGFGICRESAAVNLLAHARRERAVGLVAAAVGDGARAVSAAAVHTTAPQALGPAPSSATPPVAAETAAHIVELPQTAPDAANVVAFPASTPPDAKAPGLTPIERSAFRELAQELSARLRAAHETAGTNAQVRRGARAEGGSSAAGETAPDVVEGEAPDGPSVELAQARGARSAESVLLEEIPLGVLIYQDDALLYANRHFLELSGYRSLDALAAAGGRAALFPGAAALAPAANCGGRSLAIVTGSGDRRAVEARLYAVPWGAASAHALVLSDGDAEERRQAAARALVAAESEIRALTARIERFERTEEEMRSATQKAHAAAAAKAEFLSKVSHEIRTPLNAIIGFTEVIMAERFGPIGNERYVAYLKDVHAAGMHLVSLLNDLLDLSKIETGQLELAFANVSLNDLTKQCVGIMQPQASRARIIIRTALAPASPQVVADERSLRQIVLNLLSNSIRSTGPGSQVIVSTAFVDNGEAVLRVRDTGVGMSEKDVEAALEPFQQIATSGSWGSGGTGLGLPLIKALAEANRARFSITSAPNAGTLIEVAFPPARVVAQ